MFAKKSGRTPFRSNRRSSFKKNSGSYVSRPRSRGNVYQLFDKYTKLAKEASSSGDRIQSEYYYQLADHYSRMMNEMGIKSNEIDVSSPQEDQNDSNERKTIESKETLNNDLPNKAPEEDVDDEDSLESVSFISKPAKKKIK